MTLDTIAFETAHPLEAVFTQAGFLPAATVEGLDYPQVNAREPEVTESLQWFWVVIRDQRSGSEELLRVEKFRPYKWQGDVGDGPQTCYGWVDAGGNVVSNAYASVQPFDEYQVVLLKPV